MRLVGGGGELNDLRLDVSLVAMVFRTAESCIVLSNLLLDLLLN